jgi:hypothetical protein
MHDCGAEGGIPFGFDQAPPVGGDASYDLPLDPGENRFPRESGSDSYSGIPGDGEVPG